MEKIQELQKKIKEINQRAEQNTTKKAIGYDEMADVMKLIIDAGKIFSEAKNKMKESKISDLQITKDLARDFDAMIDNKFPININKDRNASVNYCNGVGMLMLNVVTTARSGNYVPDKSGKKDILIIAMSELAVFYNQREKANKNDEINFTIIDTKTLFEKVKTEYEEYMDSGDGQFKSSLSKCFEDLERNFILEQDRINGTKDIESK